MMAAEEAAVWQPVEAARNRLGFAYVFHGPLWPTGPDAAIVLNRRSGAALLGVWTAMAIRASNATPIGWLLDARCRAVTAEEIATDCSVPVSLVWQVLSELTERGVLSSERYGHVVRLAEFIRALCVVGSDRWVGSSELRQLYLDWCSGVGDSPLSPGRFCSALCRDFKLKASNSRRVNGRQLRTFEGISLAK